MKSRITLTIDPAVSHRARTVARSRGKSLSSLVESLLARETSDTPHQKSDQSFSSRWAGKMKLAEKSEPLFAKLKEKYKL